MSNLSGSLNSLASTTVLDFYQPLTGAQVDRRAAARAVEVVHGGAGESSSSRSRSSRAAGARCSPPGLTIASIVYGPMLGAFLLGVLTTRANATGVITGMTVSAASMLTIWWTTKLAWTWYVLVGTAICVAVGYAVSLAAEPSQASIRKQA